MADLSRRRFLSLAGHLIFISALGSGLTAVLLRFLRPGSLSPPATFRAGRPEDYRLGEVKTAYIQRYQTWIVRNKTGFYALKAECTHLQCTPQWLPSQSQFRCPCHQSHFRRSGLRLDGPAPRALERFKISLAPEGEILVDRRRIFIYERGDWEMPEAFLPWPAPG